MRAARATPRASAAEKRAYARPLFSMPRNWARPSQRPACRASAHERGANAGQGKRLSAGHLRARHAIHTRSRPHRLTHLGPVQPADVAHLAHGGQLGSAPKNVHLHRLAAPQAVVHQRQRHHPVCTWRECACVSTGETRGARHNEQHHRRRSHLCLWSASAGCIPSPRRTGYSSQAAAAPPGRGCCTCTRAALGQLARQQP